MSLETIFLCIIYIKNQNTETRTFFKGNKNLIGA